MPRHAAGPVEVHRDDIRTRPRPTNHRPAGRTGRATCAGRPPGRHAQGHLPDATASRMADPRKVDTHASDHAARGHAASRAPAHHAAAARGARRRRGRRRLGPPPGLDERRVAVRTAADRLSGRHDPQERRHRHHRRGRAAGVLRGRWSSDGRAAAPGAPGWRRRRGRPVRGHLHRRLGQRSHPPCRNGRHHHHDARSHDRTEADLPVRAGVRCLRRPAASPTRAISRPHGSGRSTPAGHSRSSRAPGSRARPATKVRRPRRRWRRSRSPSDPAATSTSTTSTTRTGRSTPTGIIHAFAGNGQQGFAGDGGPATAATLDMGAVAAWPRMPLATSTSVMPANHRIRRVDPTGIITTFAGNGQAVASGDGGPAASAALGQVNDMAVDPAGDLFFLDGDTVRKIDTAGDRSRPSRATARQGFAGDCGPARSAQLNQPIGLAVAERLCLCRRRGQRPRARDRAVTHRPWPGRRCRVASVTVARRRATADPPSAGGSSRGRLIPDPGSAMCRTLDDGPDAVRCQASSGSRCCLPTA